MPTSVGTGSGELEPTNRQPDCGVDHGVCVGPDNVCVTDHETRTDTCPLCRKVVALRHTGREGRGDEISHPWVYVEHTYVLQDPQVGPVQRECPATGHNRYGAL